MIGALAGLNTQLGPLALSTISGEPWADFGTMNLTSNTLFMNALGQQMAQRARQRRRRPARWRWRRLRHRGLRCRRPFSAWGSALGGLGSVLGDGNASTLTYNLGGVAAGIDYRIDPRFLVGIGVGYTHGTQWVNGFQGQGWTDGVSVAAYGSFTQGGFYADVLAGYAYSSNQLQRQMHDPGPAAAHGQRHTGANQFLGQVEVGYKLPVLCAGGRRVTPFARLQVLNVNQNGLTESGANSLNLNVRQQTTNSLRTTLGADFAGAIGLGNGRSLDMAFVWAGCTSLPTRAGRSRRRSQARPRPRSPSTAPRRSAMLPSSASRPGRRSPTDVGLSALRRRHRLRNRQPRAKCRHALLLVTGVLAEPTVSFVVLRAHWTMIGALAGKTHQTIRPRSSAHHGSFREGSKPTSKR